MGSSIGMRDEEQKDHDLNEKSILLVDDQPYNIDALKIMIGSVKKKDVSNLCQVAYNGKEALEKVKCNAASF
jgi:CheY-like chemotaxis protein